MLSATVNNSSPSTKALAITNSSALNPSLFTPIITGVTSCLPCLVGAFDGGGHGEFLSQVFWYNSTISLPLDTVSIVVSDYINTTVTSSSTIYGNIASLSSSLLDALGEAEQVSSELAAGWYGGFAPYVLANGTDGILPGGVTGFAYPTPYVAVAGFSVFTNLPSAKCALDSQKIFSSLAMKGPDAVPDGVGVVAVQLTSTFYSPLPLSAADGFFGFFDLDTKLFSAFLASNTSLLSQIPYLTSCSYFTTGIGPPALQIPATVLTSTVETTIKEDSPYPTKTPAPGSPIRPSAPPQTTTLAEGSNRGSSDPSSPGQIQPSQASPNPGLPNLGAPGQSSSIQRPPSQDPSNHDIPNSNQNLPGPNQGSLGQGASDTDPTDNTNPQKGVKSPNPGYGPIDSTPGSGNQGLPNSLSNALQVASPAKVIPYAGTIIQPNEASQYNLPGIGTVSPGGPGVTANGIVYSLAPSATALVSNGIAIPITPVPITPSPPSQPGVLSFRGTSYTADSSSRFVIAGQTVTPAGPAIIVSGTPIKIAPGATAAVIGTETVPIDRSPLIPMATVAPVLTFAGLTYTAGTSSAFVIEGQTLTPGANIEVQGTRISYPSGGSEIVVGTRTEPLSFATIRPPVIAPVLFFDGSTYTADSSSHFIINGQTLAPGGVVTVSGTPISYAAAGTAVVIGASTEQVSYPQITPSATIISFDGNTYTANPSSAFIINGQSLTPGGIITVSGTPISYPAVGAAVVIGTSTEPFSYAKMSSTAKVITFDGSTYTADASSDYVINRQTLTPGGVVTVSGTRISYDSDGRDVVIGTSTEGVGIGGLIMSGFGGGGSGDGPVNTNPVAFTGGTVEGRKWSTVLLGAAVALLFCSGLLL